MRSQTPQPLPAILLVALTGLFVATWSLDGVDARSSMHATATDRRLASSVRGARPLSMAPSAGQPLNPFPWHTAAHGVDAATVHSLAAPSVGHGGSQAAQSTGAAILRGAALTGEGAPPGASAARIASFWMLHVHVR